MEQFIGRKLDGRYELQRVVGVGGMAIVFRAMDTLTNMPVALKLLKPEYLDNQEICRRFRNESKAIALLKHKNIVKIYDVSDSNDYLFIVMEYINGITLKDYIEQQGVLTWKEAVHFTSQILRALKHAHSKGIVHRDIKPQNIMLMENGDIKVMDFGIARVSDYHDAATIGNQAIGSVHYVSPEQARGGQTDERSDLYSLGVMMYEMLTGQVPFDGSDPVSVAVMHLQADPRMPRQINPSIPEGLEEITMQAMQKDPERRYQTASDMLMDIDDFKHDPGIKFEYSYMVDDSPTRYIQAINATRQIQEEVKPVKSPVIPVLASIASAFIVVFLILTWLVLDESSLFDTSKNEQLKMPNFTGLNYEEIVNDKTYSFSYKIVYEFNSEYPKDCVIEQLPVPDKEVYSTSTVTLTVSNGAERLIVPTIDGMTYDEYSGVCLNLGLSTTKYEVYDANVAAGVIINTNPVQRTDIKEGDNIEVYVSLGPEPDELFMPNFQNMNVNEANNRLTAMGIGPAAVEMVDSDKPEGTIISQKPAANSQVIPGSTTVEFVVSNGSAPTGTVSFDVKLPEQMAGSKVRVEVRVGDEVLFSQSVDTEDSLTVPVSITGAGTNKTAQVCIDGYIFEILKINFEKKEVVSREKNPDYVIPTTAPTTTTTTTTEPTNDNTTEATGSSDNGEGGGELVPNE